ncbi:MULTISPECIES: YdgH/BhsA/McbA-like domain containing protein [Pantoea]|jgi:multiple stress resistance protein BhsA|uniref:multiple stress resistance protein BhsA n=1 Tax=Pantoea TaxID=53335 RepID=UPI001C061873|nr:MULTISPECIES: YdgH/BhsA/McbA-like domain containing protein [Pantoea]
MNNIKFTLAAVALSTLTFGAFAAEQVSSDPLNQQQVGTISVQAGSSLDSVEAQLNAKADAAGAKSFRIISTTGQNKLHGTAVIYQ